MTSLVYLCGLVTNTFLGYDDNDLDLDMFCQEIIHVDIENLKRTPCLNAYLPQAHKLAHKHSMTVTEVADVDPETK